MNRTAHRLLALTIAGVLLAAFLLSGCGDKTTVSAPLVGKQRYVQEGITKLRQALGSRGQALRHSSGQVDFEAAATLLEKAVKERPDSATAHCNLGIAYWKLAQNKRAIESFRKAANLSGNDVRPLEFLGHVFSQMKLWYEARGAFDQAFRRSPRSSRILTSMATVELHIGETELARTFLRRALDLDPDYPPALYNLALVHRDRLNDPEGAAKYFQMYLRVAGSGRYAEVARRFLASATPTTLPPKRTKADPLLAAARAAIENEEFDRALVMLNRVINKDPHNPAALWELALLYDKHLKYGESAAQTYRKFKQMFPNDPRSATARQRLEELGAVR